VSLHLLASFFGSQSIIANEVIDLEVGWKDALGGLGEILARTASTVRTTFKFTKGNLLESPLCDAPENVDLFVFPWVCTEAADGLQATNYGPLRILFASAAVGSIFAFLDATDRLWPAVLEAARAEGKYEAVFVNESHKTSMLLRRVEEISVSAAQQAREASVISRCAAHAAAHDAWMLREKSSSVLEDECSLPWFDYDYSVTDGD